MSNINTIIFDIGNVLIPWQPQKLFKKILFDDVAVDRFLQTTEFYNWNSRQDAGYDFTVAIFEIENKFPKYSGLFKAYFERFEESLGEPNLELISLIKNLQQKGYLVYALTNFASELFARTCKISEYQFLKNFDGIVVSGAEKIIKPDKKIYNLICSRYNINPAKALFVDDSVVNIKAAQSFGINSIQYINNKNLLDEMQKLEINII